MHAFSYAWSLLATLQRWWSHHLICHIRKPHNACKRYGSVFYNNRSFTLQNRDFQPFFATDLDLDPITFIYELHHYSLNIYWICENEFPAFEICNLTDLQTDR